MSSPGDAVAGGSAPPSAAPGPPGGMAVARKVRRSPATWLAPVLLIAVACTQITIAQLTDLTSWKGGGFGMFASTDQQFSRFIYATAVTRGGRPVRLKLFFASNNARLPSKLHSRLRTYPNEPDLRWLARSLLQDRVIRDKPSKRDVYRIPQGFDVDAPPHYYARLASVTLQMYCKRMDLATGELRVDEVGPRVTEIAEAPPQ